MKRPWALELHKPEIKAQLLHLITAILITFLDLTLNFIICKYTTKKCTYIGFLLK